MCIRACEPKVHFVKLAHTQWYLIARNFCGSVQWHVITWEWRYALHRPLFAPNSIFSVYKMCYLSTRCPSWHSVRILVHMPFYASSSLSSNNEAVWWLRKRWRGLSLTTESLNEVPTKMIDNISIVHVIYCCINIELCVPRYHLKFLSVLPLATLR